jgi:pyruvate formate-lyase activating enzyme-like uncharacterized protein
MRILRQTWAAYGAAVSQIPGVHILDGGEVVYTGELSPGCQACKAGTWDCVFIGVQCNINCAFCCNPHAIPIDYTGSAFGSEPREITANYQATRINGVSFSGGEPFSQPKKLLGWVADFKRAYPDAYYWVYTNGLLAKEPYLERLGALGVHEIRFNMAATGYTHPTVLRHLAVASHHIPTLTVEIPAIPDHESRLLASLETWCAQGIQFLNLHEFMYEPGTNAESMPGTRLPITLPDGHQTAIDPQSRALTLRVMQYVRDHNLPLAVNDCSLQSKLRQLRGRRRSLAPLTAQPYEQVIDEELLVHHCAYSSTEILVFHPDATGSIRTQYPEHQLVRIGRRAPLSQDAPDQWVLLERLAWEG